MKNVKHFVLKETRVLLVFISCGKPFHIFKPEYVNGFFKKYNSSYQINDKFFYRFIPI